MPNSRDFLRTIRPPYFDAFYFVDDPPVKSSRLVPHLFFKIIFFLEGDMYYTIQDQRYDLIPGDVLIAPRFTPYYSFSPNQKPCRRLVIWFTQELLMSIDPSGTLKNFYEKIDESQCGARFRFTHNYQNEIFRQVFQLASERDYDRPFSDIVATSMVTLVLMGIYRAVNSSGIQEPENEDTSKLVKEVVDYINVNLQNDLSLDSIARKFFVSKFHLERIFRKQMSITVHSYIIQRRLTLARQKLYNGDSPTKIYKSCGFSNYATFYRAFQKMYHVTPKEFSDQASTIMFCEGSHSWNAWGSLTEEDIAQIRKRKDTKNEPEN